MVNISFRRCATSGGDATLKNAAFYTQTYVDSSHWILKNVIFSNIGVVQANDVRRMNNGVFSAMADEE
ncbi:hypothetical protein T4D_7065 [Trichinella pseudospiralis]|uniref:Uncharacterized protein n=1 Tax=Trichinella pseudospiralis TaxID=6337 RepID=A0A0V1FQF9_TRIPS|nr:hypothetical protein T4D_7065 [Trichinella pseudospiralis]